MPRSEPPQAPQDRPAARTTHGVRTIASSELLGGEKTVEITHGEERYRLTVTRNGKLILQK